MAVCRKWEVLATVIGEVTDGDRLSITWHGETVVDVPPRTVAHEGPVYERPVERPDTQDALNADTSDQAATADDGRRTPRDSACDAWQPAPVQPGVHHRTVRPLCPRKHGAGRECRRRRTPGRRVHRPGNRGVHRRLRPLHATGPYRGAQLALAEAYRNVAVTGATPIAVTNCLNFGSPEDPGVMWQFSEAVRGLADGCAALGIPVTGGNVSFYNQTGSTAIMPTPVVGVLGVIDDVSRRIPTGLGTDPARPCCCSATPATSSTARSGRRSRGHLGGCPPAVDLAGGAQLAGYSPRLAGRLISAAHDLSEGGLSGRRRGGADG